jgi:hypothetical protein
MSSNIGRSRRAINNKKRRLKPRRNVFDVAARQVYLASIVDAVIVSENKIRIIGSNENIRSVPRANPRPWPQPMPDRQRLSRLERRFSFQPRRCSTARHRDQAPQPATQSSGILTHGPARFLSLPRDDQLGNPASIMLQAL